MSFLAMLKSKSIWGTVITLIGYLLDPAVLNILPKTVAAIITALGAMLAAFGFRSAIQASGTATTATTSATVEDKK